MPNSGEQTNIRLPRELKHWLAKQAEQNHRSLNGEIVHRLEKSRDEQQQEPRDKKCC